MYPKQERKNRLATRVRAVFVILLALTVVSMMIVGYYMFSTISDDFARRLSRQYSIEAAANFLASTNTHFVLAQQLAHSTTISRWIANEHNEEIKAQALEEIAGYTAFAPDVFIRITVYESYYSYVLGSGYTGGDFLNFGIMGEGVLHRGWFYDTRDAVLPFNLNIQRARGGGYDYDLYVWTNHRVYYEGRFVGVMTAGSPFSDVFDAVFGGFDADVQRGYIIDNVGMVRADSAGLLQVFNDGWSAPAPAPEAADNPEMEQAVRAHLQRMQGGAFRFDTEVYDAITIQGAYRYASIAPIIGTNWSVAVLSGYPGILNRQYALISVILFIAIIIIVGIGNRMIRKVVITPLYNLTKSTASISAIVNTDLFGLERDDEIGVLARTIKQSQEEMFAAKYAMHTDAKLNAMLNAMLDSSPILCVVFDEHYNITEANQAVVEMLELPDKQTYISQFYDLCPEFQPDGTPSKDKLLQLLDLAFEKGSVKSEWTYQSWDGKTQIPCEAYFERVGLEESNVIIAYARDLREQRDMLSKLKHREELLGAAGRAAEILLTSNNKADSMSAITKSMEIVGRSVDADRVRLFKNKTVDGEHYFVMKNSWMRDGYQLNDELSLPYSNIPGWFEILSHGNTINCPVSELPPASADCLGGNGVKSIVLLPLFINDVFFGWLSVADCRRERAFSNLEMDILHSTAMMFVNVYRNVEQVAEIKEAIVKTEKANRAKTKFLSNMSHEIRTPMNSVLGITEQQLQKDTHPPETEEAFMRIYSSSNMLLSIINDILDLSKVEAGKMEIIPAAYETAGLIADTVQLNIMYIGSKNIEFKLSVDERLPVWLIGDELRIKQTLNNLLSNAFKYTMSGTVSLSFSLQGCAEGGDTTVLVISVSDTGQGMTEEQVVNLFEDEFTRYNLHENQAIQGIGLGMAITQQLVRMMGGDISVKSRLGEGSTFTVKLPQEKKGGEVIGEETVSRLQNLEYVQKSLKAISKIDREPMPYGSVLVVDDVETNLYVAKGYLMPYKIAVETAVSGKLAIEKIKNGQAYDIIFMDHLMPGMDGIETANIIRGMGYDGPIVALTANALSGAPELFMQNGFNYFISKPVDVYQLDRCLLRFIRDKQPPEVVENARKAKAGSLPRDAEADKSHDKLVHAFLSDARMAISVLEPLAGRDDLSADELIAYTTQAHAMKSALRAINRYAMSEAAGDLEAAGHKADMPVIHARTPEFLSELREIAAGLKPPDETDAADTGNDEDSALLREQLLAVKQACDNYDIEAADSALKTLDAKAWSVQTRALLAAIYDHILCGELEKASALITY